MTWIQQGVPVTVLPASCLISYDRTKPKSWRFCWNPSDLRRPYIITAGTSLGPFHGCETQGHVPSARLQGPDLRCVHFTFCHYLSILFYESIYWAPSTVDLLRVGLGSLSTNTNTRSCHLGGDKSIKIRFQCRVMHAATTQVAQSSEAAVSWGRERAKRGCRETGKDSTEADDGFGLEGFSSLTFVEFPLWARDCSKNLTCVNSFHQKGILLSSFYRWRET